MAKDKRYAATKVLIESGHIQTFRQIFDHIPRSVVYSDLGINYTRFKELLSNTARFTLQELIILGKLFEMDAKTLIDMAYDQFLTDQKGKKRK